jgi:probable HAF family extracellular repeat protein
MKPSVALTLLTLGFLGPQRAIRADAFLDVNGVFTTINVPGASETSAGGINDLGQIVGFYRVTPNSGGHGFIDTNGVFTTIDFPGAEATAPFAINNSGQIVGLYEDSANIEHPFWYVNGAFTTLNGGFATGINNVGQIVGSIGVETFVYMNGSYSIFAVPGAGGATPGGINDAGQIAGYYGDPTTGVTHGFLKTGANFTTIDVLGVAYTAPSAINNTGEIVGTYIASDTEHGFLDINGTFITVDFPGASRTNANGINNTGDIVGAFTPGTPTPEPASILLFATGLACIVILIGRKRDDEDFHVLNGNVQPVAICVVHFKWHIVSIIAEDDQTVHVNRSVSDMSFGVPRMS